MLEKDLSKKFIKEYPSYSEKIDPKTVNAGIPDILVTDKKDYPVFIELKYLKKKFKTKKIPLKSYQVLWLMKYPSKAFILIQVEDEYFIFHKIHAKTLYDGVCWAHFNRITLLKSKEMSDVVEWFYKFN